MGIHYRCSGKLNFVSLSSGKSSAEVWLSIFWSVNDPEGGIHLPSQIPGRAWQGGGGKAENTPEANAFPYVIEQKNKHKTPQMPWLQLEG